MTENLLVRRAAVDDLPTILGLIDDAADWLRTKDTDQWAKPWPSRRARDERVLRGLRSGVTWLVEDHAGDPVATITYRQHGNQKLWSHEERREPAVYVSRLIVRRKYAGLGIGEALIDWAGQRAISAWGARWVRIDVWTTNGALQNYYQERGFTLHCKLDFPDSMPADERYPSAVLLQMPAKEIDSSAASRFAIRRPC